MSDMLATIVPKSDQLNADNLVNGQTLTITITAAKVGGTPEQPVTLYYENDNGRPYKPCKSMRRVLVHAWGNNSVNYVGKSLTLYTDPKVKFGGAEVGGLRISHMSHVDGKFTVALTASKAQRKPYTVEPLPGDWATPAKPKADKPARNWEAELKAAANLEALGKVWTAIPPKDKPTFAEAKDARKAELSTPAPSADILALIDELTALPGGQAILEAAYREDNISADDMVAESSRYGPILASLIRQAQEANS